MALRGPLRLRRDQSRRGAPPHLGRCRDDPLEGGGGDRQRGRGSRPSPFDPGRHQPPHPGRRRGALRVGERARRPHRAGTGDRLDRTPSGSAVLRRRHRDAGRRVVGDAARCRGGFCGLGDLQERGPFAAWLVPSSRRPLTSPMRRSWRRSRPDSVRPWPDRRWASSASVSPSVAGNRRAKRPLR